MGWGTILTALAAAAAQGEAESVRARVLVERIVIRVAYDGNDPLAVGRSCAAVGRVAQKRQPAASKY